MKKYKFVFINILVIIFLLFIVKNTKYKQPGMVNMEEMAKAIFSDYRYVYTLSSKNGSAMVKITISKEDMPLSAFSRIKDNILIKNWVEAEEYNGLHTFCFGEKNMLQILYPKDKQHKFNLPNNNWISISDTNNWVIDFYYWEKGLDECY